MSSQGTPSYDFVVDHSRPGSMQAQTLGQGPLCDAAEVRTHRKGFQATGAVSKGVTASRRCPSGLRASLQSVCEGIDGDRSDQRGFEYRHMCDGRDKPESNWRMKV